MFDQRTQVLLSKDQAAELKRRARRQKKSVGAIIRDAVDAYIGGPTDGERQAALDRLFSLNAPVDDWPIMKAQIERGMVGEYWKEDDGVS